MLPCILRWHNTQDLLVSEILGHGDRLILKEVADDMDMDLGTDMLDTLDVSVCMCEGGPLWLAKGKGSASTNAFIEESRNGPQLWSDMDAPFLLSASAARYKSRQGKNCMTFQQQQ